MDKTIKTVTQYLDQDYRDYAVYVVEERAIPSVIDGFKPTQRKIIFVANKVWKKGDEKTLKIFQLAGKVASDANYHHGDGSLNSAIIGMAQRFKNSMPVLEEIGQFGSLRSPEAGAPRYISTRLHPNFRQLYMDFELLESNWEEGVEIEPDYFLPIIPTVLLNGSSGIAVGFATNILNRNPVDLIDACLKELSGKPFTDPTPWYSEFSGPCIQNTDNQASWTFKGRYELKNTTTVQLTELPPSVTYEKFDTLLSALEEDRQITEVVNNCRSNINYIIKFRREDLKKLETGDKLDRLFKLEERQTENFTVLDEHGKIKIFSSATEIIKYFVQFRLAFYDKRKAYLLKKLDEKLNFLSNRALFIKAIIDLKLKVNNVPRAQVVQYLEQNGFKEFDGGYGYLLNMPIHSLTKEKYEELIAQIAEVDLEIKKISAKAPLDMYKEDLTNLKKAIK
jgi:DNA topoisomerase-2